MSEVKLEGHEAEGFLGTRLLVRVAYALRAAEKQAPAVIDISNLGEVRAHALASIAALGCLSNRAARLVLPTEPTLRERLVEGGVPAFFGVQPGAGEPRDAPASPSVRHLAGVTAAFADEVTAAWVAEASWRSLPARRC